MLHLLILWMALGFQEPNTLPVLEVGKIVTEEITEDDPVVETKILKTRHTDATERGKTYRLKLTTSGPHYIDLRSHFFDAYLVLRDEEGNVIAEDDNGLVGTHSRIVVEECKAEEEYLLNVCALYGETWEFRLRVVPGTPREIAPVERRAIEAAEKTLRTMERERGPNSFLTAQSLNNLAVLLSAQGNYGRQDLSSSVPLRSMRRSSVPSILIPLKSSATWLGSLTVRVSTMRQDLSSIALSRSVRRS